MLMFNIFNGVHLEDSLLSFYIAGLFSFLAIPKIILLYFAYSYNVEVQRVSKTIPKTSQLEYVFYFFLWSFPIIGDIIMAMVLNHKLFDNYVKTAKFEKRLATMRRAIVGYMFSSFLYYGAYHTLFFGNSSRGPFYFYIYGLGLCLMFLGYLIVSFNRNYHNILLDERFAKENGIS